jgi:hypothetical protein
MRQVYLGNTLINDAFLGNDRMDDFIVNVPLDPDAVAFLTAAAITDPTITSAINTLVVDMKEDGLWNKMVAIYPFVGGTATTHKYNLKNPADTDAAFRLTFYGGVTHSSNGVVGNGTDGYYDTYVDGSTNLSQDDVSMNVYIRNNVSDGGYDMGYQRAFPSVGLNIVTRNISNLMIYKVNAAGTVSTTGNTDSRGFFGISRTSSTTQVVSKNTTQISNSVFSTTPAPYKIYGLCYNLLNEADSFTTRQQAYSSIGQGLSDSELDTYYDIVQSFQTTLGRQV